MVMRAGGSLRAAMAWAVQPYLCLGLAIGGVVVAAGPRDAPPSGPVEIEIEDVPPGGRPEQIAAWAKRHRDACASCRRTHEDSRRRRELASRHRPD